MFPGESPGRSRLALLGRRSAFGGSSGVAGEGPVTIISHFYNGLLIHSTHGSDSIGLIGVWQANALLVKFTSGFIMLGLVRMAFGIMNSTWLIVVVAATASTWRDWRPSPWGVIAWLMLHSLTITLASTFPPKEAWSAVYTIRTSLLMSGGVGFSMGILLFSISVLLDSRGTVFTVLTWLAVLAGLGGLIGWDRSNPQLEFHGFDDHAARSMYIIYVVWLATLGVRLAKEEGNEEVCNSNHE